jgi:hypothetical protein
MKPLMNGSSRQRFDVDSLLSPSFRKTIEGSKNQSREAALPADIFKLDVAAYLASFGDTMADIPQLRRITENAGSSRLKCEALKPAVNLDPRRKPLGASSSRFGFTQH